MSRGMVCCLILMMTAALAELLCRIWPLLPWQEYSAECELCHEQRNKGVICRSFDNGRRDAPVYECLRSRLKVWNGPEFRTNIATDTVRSKKYQIARQCLMNAEIEIRARESCIIVRTKSVDDVSAVGCANAIAEGIVSDFSAEESKRKRQVLKQKEDNLRKHIKYVGLLEERLARSADSGVGAAEALKSELESKRMMITALQSQIDDYADDGMSGDSLKRIIRAEDRLVLVPPKRVWVFCWMFVVGIGACLFVVMAFQLEHPIGEEGSGRDRSLL